MYDDLTNSTSHLKYLLFSFASKKSDEIKKKIQNGISFVNVFPSIVLFYLSIYFRLK